MILVPLLGLIGARLVERPFGFGPSEFHGIGVRLPPFLVPRPIFPDAVQVDDLFRHLGPIIFSGRTTSSKVASSTKPSAIASSLSVVPFLCAVLATVVALS